MSAIKEQRWQEVEVYTWGDLNAHEWMDFRIALMESEAEQLAQGVAIENTAVANEIVTEIKSQGVKIVYSPAVMRTRTEMITSIVVSERDYKSKMISYLPLYERKSVIFNELINSYDREFRNVEQQIEVIERNIFVDTAIESLPIMERDLGIQTNRNLQYDQRREQIVSRNRASFDQTTEETIKSVAAAYGNGEVEVNKTDTPGVYEIKFIGRGIPNNMDGLKQALDIIMPAHLEIKYAFTFNPWQDLRNLTWAEASIKTWDELRIWDEVS